MTAKQPSKALKAIFDLRDLMNQGRLRIVAKDLSSVVYFYENANKQPCAIGYRGGARKPSINYRYSSEESRANAVAEWMKSVSERANTRRKKAARELKVGDVLMSMWGYDQTNIDYYLVTKLVGEASVEIVEIGVMREQTFSLSGLTVPDKTKIIGEPMIKRADGKRVRICSFASAVKEEPKVVAGCEIYQAHQYSQTH